MATKSLVLHRETKILPDFINRAMSYLPLLVLVALLLVMLFPLAMVTINSFKTEVEYNENGPFALPQNPNLDVITGTWERTEFTRKLLNSTIISVSTAVLATTISLLNAFALGIGKVKGRTLLLIFFLMAITLPGEALAYPLYYFFNLSFVKLYDTHLGVILVSAALHSAYGTYLLTTVFSAFNRDLIEAALIDGCGKIQLLFRVIVPLSRPALSVLFVYFFIWTWNDFFLPLILLISNSKQTVPVALALARGERNLVVTTQSAAALLGIIPCIIFFFLFQRTLARGTTAGSLK